MDEIEVDRVATAVEQVGDVDHLHSGLAGEIATYLPGRRVGGVRVREGRVEVHIAVRGQRPLHETGAEVRRAVLGVVGARPVDVVIGDVVQVASAAADGHSSGGDQSPSWS